VWQRNINDLSDEQIIKGLRKCIACDEFISISSFRKAAFGIVTPEKAYARIHDDRLAAQAWSMVDNWKKKTASEKEVKEDFIDNYEYLTEKLLTGEDYDI